MENNSKFLNAAADEHGRALPLPPRLLLEWEPAYRVFLGNLADTLMRHPQWDKAGSAAQAPVWSDVFVTQGLPWRSWLNSMLLHVAFVGVLCGSARLWTPHPQFARRSVLSESALTYFSPDELLPPLDTGRRSSRISRKGDPERSLQPIISLPPESDNSSQTVITPPKIKLEHDLPLPNLVAWANPRPPLAWPTSLQSRAMTFPTQLIPAPPLMTDAAERRRLSSDTAVVGPPPEIAVIASRPRPSAPRPSVVAPAPNVEWEAQAGGELNLAPSTVVEPSPELPVPAQRAFLARGPTVGGVVPPPPTVSSSLRTRRSNGLTAAGPVVPPTPVIADHGLPSGPLHQLIALSLHPTAAPPAEVAGNRRGTFASLPEGKLGAAGTPDRLAQGTDRSTLGEGNESAGFRAELPSGIFVGPGGKRVSEIAKGGATGSLEAISNSPSSGSKSNPALDARRVAPTLEGSRVAPSELTPLERQVFGERRSYSMIINMPNLNSSLGSWVIRFAELKPSMSELGGELIPPQATHKADPGYPLELMRENVKGTLSLYAVIHSDGTVGDVRVLSSPDDRLDSYAQMALSHWHFRPAQKNGNPVALEAVVMIAFRPSPLF